MSEEATEEVKAPAVELEGKAAEFLEWLEGITVLELSKLKKAIEEKFGVTASAPVMMGGMMAAAPTDDGGGAEEQTEFTVMLTGGGSSKIQVIKELRSLTSLGLKEAKELVDTCPNPVKEGVPKAEAEEAKAKLEAAGATVEIK
jgi:large subunit ribosomal protein L7/L12